MAKKKVVKRKAVSPKKVKVVKEPKDVKDIKVVDAEVVSPKVKAKKKSAGAGVVKKKVAQKKKALEVPVSSVVELGVGFGLEVDFGTSKRYICLDNYRMSKGKGDKDIYKCVHNSKSYLAELRLSMLAEGILKG